MNQLTVIRNRITRIARVFVIVFVFFLAFGVTLPRVFITHAASAPNIIGYQGRILNENSVPVTDTSLDIIFRLYDASSGGSCIWSNSSADCSTATSRSVSLTDGLFSENLGDTSDSYAVISDSIFGDNATLYLDINIEGEALTPRKLIVSAPYALNADTLDGISSASFLQTANNLSDLADASTARTNLGLAIGSDVQAYDAGLASISGLTTSANKGIYTTGSDTYATYDLSAFGLSLVDDADSSAARTTLGLAIGSDVQAWDADLDTYAGITPSANIQSLLGSADYATARTNLGLAIGSDVQAYDAQLDDLAALALTDGNIIVGDGTNWVAESGATARTSLGLGTGNSPQFDGLTINSADPSIVFDTTTATDTDFWIGINEDAGSDDDDNFQIGHGTTSGTDPFLTINSTGSVSIGTETSDSIDKMTVEGGNIKVNINNETQLDDVEDDGAAGTPWLDGVHDVVVQGNYLYAVSYVEDAITIFDISDRDDIQKVGEFADTGDPNAELDGAWSIEVDGKYAYVVGYIDDGLEILDISDPGNPTHKGALDNAVSGTLLDGANDVFIQGNFAYVLAETDSALNIIDIKDPANPALVGTLADDIAHNMATPKSVHVVGKYAYVTSYGESALSIIDISNPASPSFVSEITEAGDSVNRELSGAHGLFVDGRYAYIASYTDDGVEIVDISNPALPTHAGAYENASDKLNGATDIIVSGKYAYVSGALDDGIAILDISDVSSIQPVSNILDDADRELDGPAGMALQGNRLFVAGYDDDGVDSYNIPGLDAPNANIGQLYASKMHIGNSMSIDQLLSVRGALKIGGEVSAGGNLSIGGRIYSQAISATVGTDPLCWDGSGGSWIGDCTSSIRYKDNVVDLSLGLDDMLLMRPVEFDWDPEFTNNDGHDLGFIAEELELVSPMLVTYRDGEIRGVRYMYLTSLIVKSMQEMYSEMQEIGISGLVVDSAFPEDGTFMTVNASGDVGIGIDDPNYKLHVDGSVGATGFVNLSTRASKKDIQYFTSIQYDDALAKLQNVDVATYHYKNECVPGSTCEDRLGLIADDAPVEILSANGLGVDLYKFTSLLAAGIKAQQSQIDALKVLDTPLSLPSELNLDTLSVANKSIFNGEIIVKDRISFNSDTIGQAKILAGDEVVEIIFDEEYQVQPIVTLTVLDTVHENLDYAVSSISVKGFTIEIDQIYQEDILFSWHAFGSNNGKIYVSDGEVIDIEIIIDDNQVLEEDILIENDPVILDEILEDNISEDWISPEDNVIEDFNVLEDVILDDTVDTEDVVDDNIEFDDEVIEDSVLDESEEYIEPIAEEPVEESPEEFVEEPVEEPVEESPEEPEVVIVDDATISPEEPIIENEVQEEIIP